MKRYSLEKPRIISSAHGSLDRILIVYPSSKKYPVDKLLCNLLQNLPHYTRFLILVENQKKTISELQHILAREKVDFYVRQQKLNQADLYKNKKCCVLISPMGHDYSIWIQDPFIVLKDANSNNSKLFLLEPFGDNIDMDSDHEIANFLAENNSFESYNIPLIFHGGNILVGDDFFLLGSSQYYKSKEILKENSKLHFVNRNLYEREDDYVKTVFSDLLGADRKLIIVGPKDGTDTECSQPMYHIDTFVSLAGRNETGEYIVIVGFPIASTPSLEYLIKSLKDQIDIIAKSLRKKGFVVLRNPFPLVRKHIDEGPYYPCLYNNAIVEITGKKKRVWLPTFAHDKWKSILIDFEKDNIDLWQSLGFEVIQLMNFHPFIENRGAVNCIVKQLERGTN